MQFKYISTTILLHVKINIMHTGTYPAIDTHVQTHEFYKAYNIHTHPFVKQLQLLKLGYNNRIHVGSDSGNFYEAMYA